MGTVEVYQLHYSSYLAPSFLIDRNGSSRLLKNAPRTLADPLCGSLCDLCVSVVSVFVRIFTTETQRTTEIAQRNRYPARADDFFSSLQEKISDSHLYLSEVSAFRSCGMQRDHILKAELKQAIA